MLDLLAKVGAAGVLGWAASRCLTAQSNARERELLSCLYKLNQSKRSPQASLDTMKVLCDLFGSPESAFQVIHVAGTNGKGSVTLRIAKTLEEAGYKVGLFTSPHLSSFRERVRVNGEMISQKMLIETLESIFERCRKANTEPPLFFEATTLLAFLCFRRSKVDFAVIEAGVGGRLDSTNVVSPAVSVITSVGLDHCEVLGNTVRWHGRTWYWKPSLQCQRKLSRAHSILQRHIN